ncbi:centrosomal protein of 152 kDa-like [Ctenodactylus gundi]
MLVGLEKSRKNNVNQNIPQYTDSNSSSVPGPKRKPACNLQRRLEDSEHRDVSHVGPQGSPSGFLFGDSSCRHPGILPKTVPPKFISCEGKEGFDLCRQQDGLGDPGSDVPLQSPAYPFLGTFGNRPSPGCAPGLSESGSTYLAFSALNERPGLKAYTCSSLLEDEDTASRTNLGLGVQETPVRDGGDPGDSIGWLSSCATLPCDSHEVSLLQDKPQGTLDVLGESVEFKQLATTSCLLDTENSTSCPELKHQCDLGPDPAEEARCSQQGKVSVALGKLSHQKADILKSDFKNLNSTVPASACRQPLSKFIAPLSSQQDSGFDSPFVNLD